MTIAAIIIAPTDQGFCVPVSTESFFKRCWIPGIQSLQLEMVSYFADPGIDLTKEHFPELVRELSLLREWANKSLEEKDATFLIGRVDFLIQKMTEVFNDEAVILYIG
ncbi:MULTISPECIES: hypothetical protein [unclassified Paenibacillus]|uniref:hypothetical protein n=1 Tax=unclassified Paenibacillus TaxID=185978 RepID=UPI000FE22A8A|nr:MULTISPECIES: hypothetical protein [unclassified Paenibacillus]MCM3172092.1 hypothetical protein [Paenibacillus sp. MER 99-2]